MVACLEVQARTRHAPQRSDFKSALTPPAFSTFFAGALGAAAIASSRLPWRSCGGLFGRPVLDLTRWWVLRNFAASRRTARLFQPSAIAIKRQACARHRARSALSLIGLRRPPRASQWLWPVSRTVMIDANWRCFEPRSRFGSRGRFQRTLRGVPAPHCTVRVRDGAHACWRLRQLCSWLHFQAPSKVGMASIFSPSSCSARSRS